MAVQGNRSLLEVMNQDGKSATLTAPNGHLHVKELHGILHVMLQTAEHSNVQLLPKLCKRGPSQEELLQQALREAQLPAQALGAVECRSPETQKSFLRTLASGTRGGKRKVSGELLSVSLLGKHGRCLGT